MLFCIFSLSLGNGIEFYFLLLCNIWTALPCLLTLKLCKPQNSKGRPELLLTPELCQLDTFEARGSQTIQNSCRSRRDGGEMSSRQQGWCSAPCCIPCLGYYTIRLSMEGVTLAVVLAFLIPAFFLHLSPSLPIDLVSCLISFQLISCVALETFSVGQIKNPDFLQKQFLVKVISSIGSATVSSLILYFESWTGIVANESWLTELKMSCSMSHH